MELNRRDGFVADVLAAWERELQRREAVAARKVKIEMPCVQCDLWRTAAAALWQLLDDIDTQDDACRENDAVARERMVALARRRAEVAGSDGYKLYWKHLGEQVPSPTPTARPVPVATPKNCSCGGTTVSLGDKWACLDCGLHGGSCST